MLSWLTGSTETTQDHEDVFAEPPETPAPVFAVRAFKHAIFGTPGPTNHERSTARTMTRHDTPPQSTTAIDMPKRSKDDLDALVLPSIPGFSPSKPNGILLTPGTTRRSKSVTFGAQVVDNEGKKQGRTGLPNSYPGKFPSPWTPKDELDINGQPSSRARTKLTAQLLQVRDSAQKERSDKIGRAKDDTDLTMDYMEPRSQSGRYWKREYESYAEKTQREMKKLVVKQKAAKDFAKEKEDEVAELRNELRREKLRVETLEARTSELTAQLKEFEKKILSRTSQDAQDEIFRFRAENQQLRQDLDQVLIKKSSIMASPRRKTPKSPKSAPANDLWADAAFSSPFVHEIDPPKSKQQSPLRARDMNIPETTPKPTKAKPAKKSPTRRPSMADDSFEVSLNLPQLSPEPIPRAISTPRKSVADVTIEELVDKYSPEKFDRLALPLSSGAPPQTKSEDQGKEEPAKPSRRVLSDEKIAQAKARIEARKKGRA